MTGKTMMKFVRDMNRFGIGIVRALSAWRIFVGKRPEDVRGPAVILFPLQPGLLACGLAGIVTIKRAGPAGETSDVERLAAAFGRVRARGMKALRMGVLLPQDYLEPESLRELEAGTSRLKEDASYQDFFFRDGQVADMKMLCEDLAGFVGDEERELEEAATSFSTAELEILGSRQILLKDILWALEQDLLANVERITALAGAASPRDVDPVAFGKYRRMNFLLNCIDRLEVRGRDSAGLTLAMTFPDGDHLRRLEDRLREERLYEAYSRRTSGGDLLNGSIRLSERGAGNGSGRRDVTANFVYKTSSIIGELGRNVRELRKAVSEDPVLRFFVRQETLLETSLTHTRWASVGSITEENCHPVNSFTLADRTGRKAYPRYGVGNWAIHVVLNGDIDNYPELRKGLETDQELIAPALTTDTKIIPLQIEHYLLEGYDLAESFRLAVSSFEGSHAIAMTSDLEPGKAFLALRGSGQTIYIGLAPDQYVFSSELYGIVERTPWFIKMDGEAPADPDIPESTGQVFVLHQESEGAGRYPGLRLRRIAHCPGCIHCQTGRDDHPGHRPGKQPPLLSQGNRRIRPVHPKDPPGKIPHSPGKRGGSPGRLQHRRGHRAALRAVGPSERRHPAHPGHRARDGSRGGLRRGRRHGAVSPGVPHPRGRESGLGAQRIFPGR
jgi:glucosamine--fructose-6-phosphate aminotransferase (isomerizing)